MATPTASTKSLNDTQPEAQGATANEQNAPPAATAPAQEESGAQGEGEGQPSSTEPEGGYPPQRHAGAIGLGPEYAKTHGATLTDKVVGLKDEAVGRVTRNQAKVQHGKEQRTGELKRKKLDEDENEGNPFDSVDDDEKKVDGVGGDEDDEQSLKKAKTDADAKDAEEHMDEDTNYAEQPGSGNTATATVTGKRGSNAAPTEKGAEEQAATTAPEGTEEAEKQRHGENTYQDKQIDEGQNTATSV